MNTSAVPNYDATAIAARVLEAAKNEFEGTSTWLALADANGTVVADWPTGDRMRRSLRRSEIERGFGFAVSQAGRNGIGMALSTPSLAFVSGEEHEDERFQSLSCVAAAVRHPLTKEVVGVLNLSTLAKDSSPLLKVALRHTAKDVSRALYGASQSRQRRLFESHLRIKSSTRAIVVTLDATMLLVDGDARRSSLDRESLWQVVEQMPSHASSVRFKDGSRAKVVPLDSSDRGAGVTLVFDTVDPSSLLNDEQPDHRFAHLSPLEAAERKLISETLRLCEGNKKETAQRLQISRGTLYERIKRYGISTE